MARNHPQKQQGLCALLCESFTPGEFVSFIKRCEASDDAVPYRLIHNLLPYEYTPAEPYFQHALEVMARRNLVDARFLAAMAHERPFRAQRIKIIAEAMGIDISKICDLISSSCDHPEPTRQSELGPGEARRRAAVDHLDVLLRRRFESTPAALSNKEQIIHLSESIINSFTPRPGLVVAGAILERRHEAGAFGQIWLSRSADDPSRILATKIIHLHHLRSGQFLYHFRRGCRAMQILNMARKSDQTPSIVQLRGLSGDTLAFSMDYLPNGNLVEIAALQWSLETKLAKFRKICEAIGFAHRNGITHRDIRPANIVLDGRNEPVVTDFDIADAEFFTMLSISVRLGTQAFAAPEQLRGKKRGEATADVYSLGRLLHFMLIERDPPESKFSRAVVRSLRSFPQILARIITRATEEDPRDRYQSVADLLTELDRHEVDTEVSKSPDLPTVHSFRPRVAISSSLMAAFGISAAWMFRGNPTEDRVLIAETEPMASQPRLLHIPSGPNPRVHRLHRRHHRLYETDRPESRDHRIATS